MNWFTAQKLNENIYGIGEFQHFEEVISYLVIGNKKALLWDTGMGIEDIKDVVTSLTDKEIIVINSHTHFDHVGGNHLFDKSHIFNTTFAINNAQKGIGNSEIFEYIKNETFFNEIPKDFNEKKFSIKPFKYETLEDKEIIKLSPFEFEIIHTPGHSPDSICLYEREKGWLFTGDTLYNGPIYLQMEESNVEDYKKSLGKLSKLNVNQIFSGHNEYLFDPTNIYLLKNALNTAARSGEIEIKGRLKLLI